MSSAPVDDTDSRFNYKNNAWAAGGVSGEFETTHHSTSTAGAQVIFGPFSGTSIAVFSTIGSSQPKIHFFVDGGDQNVDTAPVSSSGINFQQQVYSASSLDPSKLHTLQINVLDSGPFTLDYVLIDGTSTKAATPIATPPSATPTTEQTQTVTQAPSTSTADPTDGTTTIIITPNSPTDAPTSTSQQGSNGGGAPAIITARTGTLSTPQQTTPPSASSSLTILSSSFPISSPTTSVASSASGADGKVIGSVTAAVVVFAVFVAGLLYYLRRRHYALPLRRSGQSRLGAAPPTTPKSRPSLFVDIPDPFAFRRNRPNSISPVLPIHTHQKSFSNSSNSALKPSNISPRPTAPTHSFLAEDPNDSPIFDIKARPISGQTMATRVTAGTSIGQRASVPDYYYQYPYAETPVPVPVPAPALPPLKDVDLRYGSAVSPTDTETASTSPTETWTEREYVSRKPTASSAATELSSNVGYGSERATESPSSRSGSATPSATTGVLQSPVKSGRALPAIPTNVKMSDHNARVAGRDTREREETYTRTRRYLPMSPGVEAVVHQDAGVTLESSSRRRRVDLPPEYNSIGFQ